jgi:hypothetical protein
MMFKYWLRRGGREDAMGNKVRRVGVLKDFEKALLYHVKRLDKEGFERLSTETAQLFLEVKRERLQVELQPCVKRQMELDARSGA